MKLTELNKPLKGYIQYRGSGGYITITTLIIHKKYIKLMPFVTKSPENTLTVVLKPIKNKKGKASFLTPLDIKTVDKDYKRRAKTVKKHYVEVEFLFDEDAKNFYLTYNRLEKIKNL
jgi:hypothetical protein